jgi:hypothetical protein
MQETAFTHLRIQERYASLLDARLLDGAFTHLRIQETRVVPRDSSSTIVGIYSSMRTHIYKESE